MSLDRDLVVLLGHSYIRRIRRFVDDRDMADLRIQSHAFDLMSLGIGGALVTRPANVNRFIRAASMERTTVVYVHLGEVDLLQGHPPYRVAREICRLADRLAEINAVVYVSQLLPFPLADRSDVVEVNRLLDHHCRRSPNVHYWRHHGGFWNCGSALFHPDRVHLSPRGEEKYFYSIRAAVKKGLSPAH